MAFITNVIIAIIAIIVIIFSEYIDSQKLYLGWIQGLTGGKHSYIQGPAVGAKILRQMVCAPPFWLTPL